MITECLPARTCDARSGMYHCTLEHGHRGGHQGTVPVVWQAEPEAEPPSADDLLREHVELALDQLTRGLRAIGVHHGREVDGLIAEGMRTAARMAYLTGLGSVPASPPASDEELDRAREEGRQEERARVLAILETEYARLGQVARDADKAAQEALREVARHEQAEAEATGQRGHLRRLATRMAEGPKEVSQ
jgi:uncharacterized protein YdbL (DUF1318 family)